MSILISHNAKVIIQGITEDMDGLFSRQIMKNGASVVGVISPGRGGRVDPGRKDPGF